MEGFKIIFWQNKENAEIAANEKNVFGYIYKNLQDEIFLLAIPIAFCYTLFCSVNYPEEVMIYGNQKCISRRGLCPG